jgi:hypothetical protein
MLWVLVSVRETWMGFELSEEVWAWAPSECECRRT